MGRTGRGDQSRVDGRALAAAKKRAAELIEMHELEGCADRKVATYSGGQKRRLDIGLGLVHDPQLLFLDEPTTGLDPQSRARVWDEVRRMHDRGTTVFLTTHYLDEADALCDPIPIIDHGKIVTLGSPEELKREVAGDLVTLSVQGDQQPALDLLKGAKRPLIILGKGAAYAQADADIRALVEKTGIPYLPMSIAK